MTQIVLAALSEQEDVLIRAGFRRQEVWVRDDSSEATPKAIAEAESWLRRIGVYRFVVGAAWGRGED